MPTGSSVFIASFVPPSLPEEALYPRRWRTLGSRGADRVRALGNWRPRRAVGPRAPVVSDDLFPQSTRLAASEQSTMTTFAFRSASRFSAERTAPGRGAPPRKENARDRFDRQQAVRHRRLHRGVAAAAGRCLRHHGIRPQPISAAQPEPRASANLPTVTSRRSAERSGSSMPSICSSNTARWAAIGPDIHRRFCWLTDAAPRLSVTFHSLQMPPSFDAGGLRKVARDVQAQKAAATICTELSAGPPAVLRHRAAAAARAAAQAGQRDRP